MGFASLRGKVGERSSCSFFRALTAFTFDNPFSRGFLLTVR